MDTKRKPVTKKVCKVCKSETFIFKSNGKKILPEEKKAWEVYFSESDLGIGKLGIEKFCHKCGSLLWIPFLETEEVRVLLHSRSP